MTTFLCCAALVPVLTLAALERQRESALDDLRTECANADVASCEQLGRIYGRGEGVPRDPARSARFFRLACDGGLQMGCMGLAVAHLSGEGIAQPSLVRAASLLEEACRLKEALACETLALVYSIASLGPPKSDIPEELRKNDTTIAMLLWRACELGSVDACLGIVNDKLRSDPPDALASLLQRATASVAPRCAAGEAQCCLDLGVLFAIGPQPDQRAAEEAKRRGRRLLEAACAAERLGSDGCTGLGEMYIELRADTQDPAKAEVPLLKACGEKHLQACWGLSRLSGLYQNGEMVPKDHVKALQLARHACALPEPCTVTALRQQRERERPTMDAPLEDPPGVRP